MEEELSVTFHYNMEGHYQIRYGSRHGRLILADPLTDV